jgi:hypothetical protein
MRVPSIGLTLEERRIVREGYALAERMLAGYQDPPGFFETIGGWLMQLGSKAMAPRLTRD